MENIGLLRRVDDLGRIVIPKEMRNVLRIKSGDSIEMFLDNDKIYLIKKEVFKNELSNVDFILNVICNVLSVTIAITDTDKYIGIYGNDNIIKKYEKITENIYKIIIKRQNQVKGKTNIFGINYHTIISPIIVNGDALGSIIIFKKENEINDKDELCIEILKKIFLNNLEV